MEDELRGHIERIDARLSDIQQMLAEVRVMYDSHHRRIERLEGTLYGNGSTGLTAKVSAILWLASAIAGFVALLVAKTISGIL
jgi:hypothetical protein